MKTVNGRITIFTMLMLLLIAGTAMANPVVDLGTGSGNPCGQVILPMTLTNDSLIPVAAVGMDIGYNSTYLTPINATIGPAGQLAGKSVAKNIVSPGLFRVGVFSSSDLGTIGDGVVAYVTFEISCDAPEVSYVLGNTPSAATPDGVDVDADGSDGTINVGAGSTTTSTIGRVPVEHIKSCNVCHPTAYDSQLSLAYHAHPTHLSDCTQCHDGIPGLGTVHLRPSKSCATCHPLENIGICNLTTLVVHSSANPGCLTCHVDCDTNDTNNHMSTCLLCHPTTAGTGLHTISAHTPCSICHPNNVFGKNVTADKCVVCHPQGNPGACNLVDLHSPSITGSCLDCHMNCAGGSLVTTTTTTASGTTTTTPGGTTTTSSIPGGTTTSVPATTTVSASSHIGTCQSCHFLNDLHASAGHTNCSQCHAGAPQRGNVTAGECIVCHPAGDPGKCNLIDFHGNTCINCHTPSMCGGSLPTTTVPATTSIPGATTTVPPGHTNSCLACHFVSDLHAQAEHNNCFQCHTGTPGKGNVEAAKCAGCHPIGNPGKCNMVEVHGSSCLTCHSSCFESNTTTTTGSTTTIPPYGHTSVCLECHFVNDIHSKTAHSNCTLCHDGTPQAGNVAPGKCVVCHPLSGPGKCNLITDTVHGSSCLTCHVSCVEGSTTTTTTILPPPECQIVSIAPPSGVKIGLGLIPRIRRITLIANADLEELGITGDDFTFEDDPRGITILSTQVLGNSVEATVLFWGARPGSYNITLAECGLISLDVSRF